MIIIRVYTFVACASMALSCLVGYQEYKIDELRKEVSKYENIAITPADSFIAECTAYTEGFESCGKLPNHPAYGITASGKRVAVGMVAADPKILPFGTKVYIDGLGIFTVEDTGSAIKGNCIDIYMPNLNDAIKFGRQHRQLIVLKR